MSAKKLILLSIVCFLINNCVTLLAQEVDINDLFNFQNVSSCEDILVTIYYLDIQRRTIIPISFEDITNKYYHLLIKIKPIDLNVNKFINDISKLTLFKISQPTYENIRICVQIDFCGKSKFAFYISANAADIVINGIHFKNNMVFYDFMKHYLSADIMSDIYSLIK